MVSQEKYLAFSEPSQLQWENSDSYSPDVTCVDQADSNTTVKTKPKGWK